MREALVPELGRDRGGEPYEKWRGAYWRLLSLVELGAGRDTPGALEAADQTLAWLASPTRLPDIHRRVIDGRVRRCASQDGRGLWACCRLGIEDERLGTLDLLESNRRPDGTWRCDRRWWKRPGSKRSNVDVVDWADTAHELLTERAQATLQAAGRS